MTSNAATGYVAKISMVRLNIGSGMLRFSSCMLSIGRGPKALQGNGGGLPPLPCSHLGPRPMLSMHELSLSMPEPMLSLSMLILATYPVAALDVTIRTQNKNWHLQISTCWLWVFWADFDRFGSILAKCSEQSRAKHVPNIPHVPNVPNTNIVLGQHRHVPD